MLEETCCLHVMARQVVCPGVVAGCVIPWKCLKTLRCFLRLARLRPCDPANSPALLVCERSVVFSGFMLLHCRSYRARTFQKVIGCRSIPRSIPDPCPIHTCPQAFPSATHGHARRHCRSLFFVMPPKKRKISRSSSARALERPRKQLREAFGLWLPLLLKHQDTSSRFQLSS